MKKKMLTVLSTLLIGCSLFAVPANAEWRQDSTGWWYAEGNSWATGWRQINGNWYYFDDKGYMVSSPNCEFNNEIGSYIGLKAISYNGDTYYFDKDGHMLHDCFVVEGSGAFQAWIDSNGKLTSGTYGNRYDGNYNLSQVKKSTVPNVIGLHSQEAESKLSNNGLNVAINEVETHKTSEDGIVLSQSSAENSAVSQGSTITINVGKYVELKSDSANNNDIDIMDNAPWQE